MGLRKEEIPGVVFLYHNMRRKCSSAPAESTAASTEAAPAGDFDADQDITVISREDGSGTRGAFIELTGVEEKNADGKKVDNTTEAAAIQSSTNGVMTAVANDETAIGYISLGSLSNDVKAVTVGGVEASAETVKDGSYVLSRPFNIVTKDGEELSDAAQDFFNYIMSTDAADVISKEGYVAQGTESYTSNGAKGSVVVAGSSSVTPVMTKLKEAYADVNPDVTVDVQQSDSTTGVTSTQEGVCDIGMASRELKDTETGVKSTVLAMDGIAVIVNKDNSLDAITKDQIKQIYTGEITEWSALTEQ